MYCPKCGLHLEQRNGTWHCASGGLELSRRLGDRLADLFAADFRPGRRPGRAMEIDLWYCPSCGVPVDGELRCPECARSIRDFLFELVELHPHADGHGGFR